MHEQEIVKQIQQRDEAGMDGLLMHYGPLMRYIIRPILPNAQDEEECLSEAAMRVWENIEQFDGQKGSWSAWLTAVTRNTARNRARGIARRREGEKLEEEMRSTDPTPEEILLKQEREQEVARALEKLTPGERTLFYRKYYYLQSTAQIACELGWTERAVEGKLYRLKKQLRRMLRGEDHEQA